MIVESGRRDGTAAENRGEVRLIPVEGLQDGVHEEEAEDVEDAVRHQSLHIAHVLLRLRQVCNDARVGQIVEHFEHVAGP